MRSRWRLVLAAVAVSSVAGCVSVPSSGPVRSLPLTQGTGGQAQQYPQLYPLSPGRNWGPAQIVQGFLTANASFADKFKVAREYLTDDASRAWNPRWSATVLKGAPGFQVSPVNRHSKVASVRVSGSVQASLSGNGNYAVPATKTSGYSGNFQLVRENGQWRISALPPGGQLLLTSDEFAEDYQPRNLYFVNPAGNTLVPDPVYVPLNATATDLANGLVQELINLPGDWLSSDATMTAFPPDTKLLDEVTVNGGTAAINLGGAIQHQGHDVLQLASAQLMATLANSEQPQVQAIELYLNGKPWSPEPGTNPVQQADSFSGYFPAPQSKFFYLCRPKAHQVAVCEKGTPAGSAGSGGAPNTFADLGGLQPSGIAVSGDKRYLAVIAHGQVYLGQTGHPLSPKAVGGTVTSVSWDANDYLWVASSAGVAMLRPGGGAAIAIPLSDGPTPDSRTVTKLQVAPDGVRIAVILNGEVLGFGAIVTQAQGHVGIQPQPQIVLSPFTVPQAGLQDVTWYDGNDVVALRSDSSLWEYPVNGGTPTQIPYRSEVTSVTAGGAGGGVLIAGLSDGQLVYNPSAAGPSWLPLASGLSPVFAGSVASANTSQ